MSIPKKIIIPKKHYVGMSHHEDTLPLGFLTPWGEDSAAKKRMATVDSRASSRYNNKTNLAAITIDNNPMIGFKLTSGIRTGQYGAVDKWRVEDPRGFELEISSPNLAQLLSLGTVEKGEFLDQCVWARDGGNNVLLSIESEAYKEATEFTKINNASASWKDVKIGYEIILQNGLAGKYLGKLHTLTQNSTHSPKNSEGDNAFSPSSKSYFVIHTKTTDKTYPKGVETELHFVSSPKLSQIVSTTEMTVSEAEIEANACLSDKTCAIEKSGYNDPILLSANTIKDCNWTLTLNPVLEYDTTFTLPKSNHGRFMGIFRLTDGRLVSATRDHCSGINISVIRESDIANGKYIYEIERYTPSYNRYNRDSDFRYKTMSIKDDATFSSMIVGKFELLVKIVTTAGNTFEVVSPTHK